MKFVIGIAIGVFAASSAFSATTQPVVEEAPSRALQQARRVASMENGKDLPSRAVWLGQRAAKNSKLALTKRSRKAKPSSQN